MTRNSQTQTQTDETEAARLWDSERRDSPFSTVADVEDEYCDACGDAHTCADCREADPLGETHGATGDVAETFEGPERDEAVAYFAETVERRVAGQVVNVERYLGLTRASLNDDADRIGNDDLLQDDQKAEKIRRVEAKLAELDRIEAEIEAAKTSPLVGSGQCVNCGGYPQATADSMDGDAGCSCVGDYAPAWKRDDVAELELRFEAVSRATDRHRGNEPRGSAEEAREDFLGRQAAWREVWDRLWIERRWVAQRIAELTPYQPADVRRLAGLALEFRAGELEQMARSHHGGDVPLEREALALRSVAAILADDSESRYRFVVREYEADDLAAALIGQGVPQGKAHRIAHAVASR